MPEVPFNFCMALRGRRTTHLLRTAVVHAVRDDNKRYVRRRRPRDRQ